MYKCKLSFNIYTNIKERERNKNEAFCKNRHSKLNKKTVKKKMIVFSFKEAIKMIIIFQKYKISKRMLKTKVSNIDKVKLTSEAKTWQI